MATFGQHTFAQVLEILTDLFLVCSFVFLSPIPSNIDCCLKNLTTYLNQLDECLFQRPKRNVSTSEEAAYDNMVVGERTLSEKVQTYREKQNFPVLHKPFKLIRATAVTTLGKSGFEARYIMAIIGHKNEISIRSYSKTDICRKKMSETLTTRSVFFVVSEELSVVNSHQCISRS